MNIIFNCILISVVIYHLVWEIMTNYSRKMINYGYLSSMAMLVQLWTSSPQYY